MIHRAMSLSEFFSRPGAYIISVDGKNIGRTAKIANGIITFTSKSVLTIINYDFRLSTMIFIHNEQFNNLPYCQHLYYIYDIEDNMVEIELGFVEQLYKEKPWWKRIF